MQVPCEQPGNFGRPAIACVWDDFWGNIAAHDRISPWLRSTEPRHEKTVLLSPALLISTALLSKSYIPKRTVPTGLSQPPPHQALLGQAGLVFDVFHNPPLHHHHQPRPTPPCPSAFSNQVMSRAQSKLCFNFRLHILHEFLSPNRSQSKLFDTISGIARRVPPSKSRLPFAFEHSNGQTHGGYRTPATG